MGDLPAGTITFLLTDLEGSTRLWDTQPEAMRAAMTRHDAVIADAVVRNGGTLVEAGREGDSVLAAFRTAAGAAAAALEIQRRLAADPGPPALRTRVAVHTGEAQLRDGHYFGPALNRCARLLAVAHPGQVLLTRATQELLADELPPRSELLDLGLHQLKDLLRPEHVFQLRDLDDPTVFPQLRSLRRRRHNLPAQTTTFVGRTEDVEELRSLFSRTRLLTLIGPGGVGKTRLALQLAGELLPGHRGGAWLVELAPVAEPSLVPQELAAALDVPEQAGRRLVETLAEHLAESDALIVLDNCEHLLEATAELAHLLLERCPKLQLLATSREPLRTPGETTWWARPLPAEDAIRLFDERAQAADPGYRAAGSPAVAEICRSLDGLPLAIELAAARVHFMPPAEILSRLDDRFRILTGGDRTRETRQQTLEAAVDWSYEQLDEAEQTLLRTLTVFAGGFTLADAEAVGAGVADAVDLLGRLVDKSLVQAEERRYRCLDTIRAYGLRKLAGSAEEGRVRRRHAERFLAVARSAEPGRLAEWLDRLEEAHDNVRAALAWSLRSDPELGLELATAVHHFWQLRGHNTEARRWLERLLAAAPFDSRLRARALVELGNFAYIEDDVAAATGLIEQARSEAERSGDREGEVLALKSMALLRLAQGDPAAAQELAGRALELAVELGDPAQEAQVLHHLGLIRVTLGDPADARAHLARSVEIWRRLGAVDEAPATLGFLGAVALIQGDEPAADAAIAESLRIGERLKDRRLAWTLDIAAWRLARARPESAVTLAGAADGIHASIGSRPPAGWQAVVGSALEPARKRLGPEAAERAYRRGREMAFEEAVAFALAEALIPV